MSLRSTIKFWIRQFPFIYPKELIYSCKEWIDKQQRHKGLYFSQRGPWYKDIFPADFLHNPAPQTLGIPNEEAFYNNRSYLTPIATLFCLQNSFLLGHKGLILSADHRVFQEFSHHFGISSLKRFFQKNPFYTSTSGFRKMNGIGAVLISPESQNYYHWLNDVLPRIKLYEAVFDQVDHFCISSNVPQKFLDILVDLGISAEKIVLVKENEKLHFDYLFVSSLPGSEGRSPRWAADYLRNKLIKTPAIAHPFKKLYFKRGNGLERNILNEESLVLMLQNNGFDTIDPDELTIPEQINLMQQAKIVVSAHGAALSNLLFNNDKTTVIELFSPDYFRTDCYYTLSAIRELNYWYLAGIKPAGANWGDIMIDEDLLLKTIHQANAG
jgi:hypothetical protein